MASTKKAQFITPPNRLKMKAGNGGLPQQVIEEAQKTMDAFEVDFGPDASRLIVKLSEARKHVLKTVNQNQPYDKDDIINPVMQLKANGGQFKYQLISDVADICLQFLETLEDYNPEALDVVKAHETTIEIIINSNLRGSGGKEGSKLVEELHNACARYFKKYKFSE